MGRMKFSVALVALLGIGSLAGCVTTPVPPPPSMHHPAYLHALSDLRAARWLIEHRPGDWSQTADEQEAVRQIDAGIGEIKQAALNDGKNLSDHPPVDERSDHRGRIHEAIDFLKKARRRRGRRRQWFRERVAGSCNRPYRCGNSSSSSGVCRLTLPPPLIRQVLIRRG